MSNELLLILGVLIAGVVIVIRLVFQKKSEEVITRHSGVQPTVCSGLPVGIRMFLDQGTTIHYYRDSKVLRVAGGVWLTVDKLEWKGNPVRVEFKGVELLVKDADMGIFYGRMTEYPDEYALVRVFDGEVRVYGDKIDRVLTKGAYAVHSTYVEQAITPTFFMDAEGLNFFDQISLKEFGTYIRSLHSIPVRIPMKYRKCLLFSVSVDLRMGLPDLLRHLSDTTRFDFFVHDSVWRVDVRFRKSDDSL